ncbi:putative soyasaponin III rhamnosyltransferase [Helianthus anomalus]
MDVRIDDIPYLKKAFDGLLPEVTRFLEEESPDWIIYDFAPYWLPSIAAGLGISKAFLSMLNTWFIAFRRPSLDLINNITDGRTTAEDFMTPPKWVTFPSKHKKACIENQHVFVPFAFDTFGALAPDSVRFLKRVQQVVSSNTAHVKGQNFVFSRVGFAIQKGVAAQLVARLPAISLLSVNASGVSDAYRSGMLTLLEKLHHIPVVPVGLMPPETPTNVSDETWVAIKKWVDARQKGHVVYVALGSRKWVLETTSDRGVVWKSWAPQLKILSHESVGGFLTQCGWSSIVEGLMFSHPLVMLPFVVEQGLNARILVDKQVGIEIPRNEEDGSFTKESVARSVR